MPQILFLRAFPFLPLFSLPFYLFTSHVHNLRSARDKREMSPHKLPAYRTDAVAKGAAVTGSPDSVGAIEEESSRSFLFKGNKG